MKVCTKCGRELPEEMFHKDGTRKDGLRIYCKECQRRYYEEHREQKMAYDKKHYEEHKEEIKKYKKKYREEHRIELREYDKKYCKTERGKATKNLIKYNRRVRKKNNGGSFTVDEWLEVCEKFNNECAYCGDKVEALSADHIVPIAKGGANNIKNIVPACLHCNKSKKATDLTDWYPAQSFFTAERYQKIIEHAHLKA